MAYYILSIIMTLGLIHIVPIRLRNHMVVLITITSIFLFFILFVRRLFFYNILHSTIINKLAAIVDENELTQVLYGALVATLLYYWFSKEGAFDRIHIVGAAAALVVFGFLIPAVERLPERISGVSSPIFSITLTEHSPTMTPDPVVTPHRNEQIFGGETQPRNLSIVLSSGLAHPDPDKGHVNRDKKYAEVEQSPGLAERMDKINAFIVDVFQPLVACSDSIRREMGSSHLFKDDLLEVAAAFRLALNHAKQPHIQEDTQEDTWQNFRREYAGAQLRILQEIGRHNVPLKSDGSDTSAFICRLTMTARKYPTNPFNAKKTNESIELPYGPIVLALLLYTAGEKDAAKHELKRWLDHQENPDTAPTDEADRRQQWFNLRARLYLSDMLKEVKETPQYRQDMYRKIKEEFEGIFPDFIPLTAASMKERTRKCSGMHKHKKDLLFAHITYLNDGIENAVRGNDFSIRIEDVERVRENVEYLSAVKFDCFKSIKQLEMFKAHIYMIMAEAYLKLAIMEKTEDRIGNQQYRRWLEQAEEQLRKAVPIWNNLDKQAETSPPDHTEFDPAHNARAQYDKATKWLLEIRRYTRQN